MARPSQITEQQILTAAREVFLERGIRATTAEVARRAGIAEGSIFHRFKTKDELFFRCMEPAVNELPWARTLASRAGRGDVRETLYEAGMETIAFFRQIMPLIMMSWSNQGAVGGVPPRLAGPDPPPLRAFKLVASYFDAEMRRGRLRRHDPEILARAFLGSIQNYVFFEVLMKNADHLPLPAEIFMRGLVHLIWTGAAPEASPKPRRGRARARSRR